MIKFILSDTEINRQILGMVITKENVEKLKEGKPIHFNAEDMGFRQLKFEEIIISYFETIEEATEYFKKTGLLDKETKIHVIPTIPTTKQ